MSSFFEQFLNGRRTSRFNSKHRIFSQKYFKMYEVFWERRNFSDKGHLNLDRETSIAYKLRERIQATWPDATPGGMQNSGAQDSLFLASKNRAWAFFPEHDAHLLLQSELRLVKSKGPFTLAIFAAILAAIFAAILATISSAISNRPCKLLAIPRRFESPVVYTPRIAAKIASVNEP